MELKSHWASCSETGNINFHWKCMMAPLKVIDYIIIHELAHLIHKNHTDAFWNTVDKVLPDYQQRKEWLRKYGAMMDL
jgi:predicted metal-dependent hydrolase